MGEQKNYQPLLEKILENLSSEREVRTTEGLGVQFDLDVPTIQPAQVGDTSPIQQLQTEGSSHFYPNLDDLADLANTPANAPHPLQEDYTQKADRPAALPPLAPLPSLQINDAPVATNLYNTPAMPGNSLDERLADLDEIASFKEASNSEDQIPDHFYRPEQIDPPRNKPVRNVLFGLTGATLLGAISVFLLPQDPPSTGTNIASIEGPKLFAPEDDKKAPAFSAATGNIVAQNDTQKIDATNEVTLDEARTIPLSAEKPIEKRPTPIEKPKVFASINGPLDTLVQNVVKDLAVTLPVKKAPTPAVAQNTKPVPGANATLNQLEKSLEDIGSLSSSSQANSGGKIVVAQNMAAPKGNPDRLQALTDDVVKALSDLGGPEGSGGMPLGESVDRLRNSLSNLVQEAESRGKSAGSVELLIKEALGDNQKNLPDALKDSQGNLDITSLIASIVKRADGGNSPRSAADANYLSLIEDEGQNTALSSRFIKNSEGKRYLIVKRGDTLSSIAYATYGDSFMYPRIFQANKAVIANPNTLRIGIRLVIPN